jgi:hypothetical protein
MNQFNVGHTLNEMQCFKLHKYFDLQEIYVHVCKLQHVKLQRFGISKLCMMLVFRFNQLYAFSGGLNSCIMVMLTLSNLSCKTYGIMKVIDMEEQVKTIQNFTKWW